MYKLPTCLLWSKQQQEEEAVNCRPYLIFVTQVATQVADEDLRSKI